MSRRKAWAMGLSAYADPWLIIKKGMGGNMKCLRCGGIMVYEKFFGLAEDFFGWRCIFCGEIIDKVILKNRRAQKG